MFADYEDLLVSSNRGIWSLTMGIQSRRGGSRRVQVGFAILGARFWVRVLRFGALGIEFRILALMKGQSWSPWLL